MKKLLKALIKNRKITLLFIAVILISGIYNYYVIPKQEAPDFEVPYAVITTIYPGANQEDVDKYVTSEIEQSIKQIDGYKTSISFNYPSLSLIVLKLEFNADQDKAYTQLDKKMSLLQKKLPKQVQAIDVNTKITDEAGVILSLSSKEYDYEQLNTYANKLSKKLTDISGVNKFETKGFVKQQVIVEIDTNETSQLGISLEDITNIIKINNIDMPFGSIESKMGKIAVEVDETYKSIDDVKEIVVGYNSQLNRIVKLDDISNIYLALKANDTNYIYENSDAILIVGYFEDNQNILLIGDQIKEEIENCKKELPKGITLTEILFQPEEVENSINTFMQNLLMSILLVILVVLIGMGFRNAIIISISIPMSILISFSIMRLFGIIIHQISIVALIVSLGMLVDNAIVISDSIQGYIDKGQKKLKACINGSKDVAVPIFTSTLTTIAAFAPFIFLNSIAGDYIKALPQIVIITLAASYVVAVLIIPVLAFMFFKAKNKKNKKQYINKLVTGILKKAMKVKWLVIVIIIIAVILTGYLGSNIDKIFFPTSDKDIIYIDILNNNSNDINGTREIAGEIAQVLNNEKSVDYFITSVGGGVPRFNKILLLYSKKPDVSQIMIRVNLEKGKFDTNEQLVDNLQTKINEKHLEAKIAVKQLMYAFPMDEDIKVQISGDDIVTVKQHELEIYSKLEHLQGLSNVGKSNANYINQYKIDINNEALSKYGVNMFEIQNELSIATLGRKSGIVREGEKQNDIVVKCDIETINDIKDIKIKSKTLNTYVEMEKLITIETIETLSTILKSNGQYALSITADYDLNFDKSETLENVINEVDKLNITDCEITYDGEAKTIDENFGQIAVYGLVVLILVFLILLVQFKSYIQPLIIFITIPLSAIGSIIGLYITKQPISFTALLGIVSLLGIVVNNAIILVDYINKEIKKGKKLEKACINSTSRRLRPIFLSTITTMIGLIPLAIGKSQLFKPMAIAIMAGLFVSTILTLVVLPVFVSMKSQKNVR